MTKENRQVDSWEYAPSLESTNHIHIKKRYELFINGEWVKPSSGKYFETINPANEEVISEIAHGNEEDIDRAVKAARKAYTEVWSVMPASERAKYIYRIARLMQEQARELAVI
jgi:aldehyde dehydrogenase (NAD+)